MNRPVTGALLLGFLNAAVAVATLALVDLLTPDEFGWFAYAPLNEAVVQDPRFPWHYIAVSLALLVTNLLVVTTYFRRAERASVSR